MKRFLKITAAIIILLLIFFAGVFKYRRYVAEQTLIPKNATSLIKINIDELYKTLASNMLGNPSYYFKSDFKKDTSNKPDKFNNGLEIPASLFFYTLQGKSGIYFSRFELKNVNDFENALRDLMHLEITKKTEGINVAKSKLGNVVIYYNRKSAAISLSVKVENIDRILMDILSQKNFVKVTESKYKYTAKSLQHIAFETALHQGYVNFDNGVVNFSDVVIANQIIPTNTQSNHQHNKDAIASLWLNADFKNVSHRVFKTKNFSIEPDSVLKYYKGSVDFDWLSTIQQTDSIVTYDYNDDFEKVAKVSLQKRDVPQFSIAIHADANGLKNYLAKQKIINLDSNQVNKSAFPLYQVFVESDQQNVYFGTKKQMTSKNGSVPSPDFFYFFVNFEKLNKQSNMGQFNNYLKTYKTLQVTGKLIGGKQMQFDGNLVLMNKNINSLYQILKGI
ncbi:hypothetical protein [Pedobacter borealis]|uniref:hypothetical protein n=1 Tax=Pedobacter borealis TaxID=475254 RepID=UPI000493944E|nr:hypothetical protein [Pedobacter borealis]